MGIKPQKLHFVMYVTRLGEGTLITPTDAPFGISASSYVFKKDRNSPITISFRQLQIKNLKRRSRVAGMAEPT
jgi:hypothetical protein